MASPTLITYTTSAVSRIKKRTSNAVVIPFPASTAKTSNLAGEILDLFALVAFFALLCLGVRA